MVSIAGGIILGFIGLAVLQWIFSSRTAILLVLSLVGLAVFGVAYIVWPAHVAIFGVVFSVAAIGLWLTSRPWCPQWLIRPLGHRHDRGT